ncbi:Ty1/Copia family ribonuclease HI, partial [Klebsiella pneumoniae]|uniref:Ty1/Copia family ribonuclease HI n=1 Tax=Klebsiella pneumoniae TaxID=573 RepID=UPI003A801DA0
RSKKQGVVARSSAESEYRSMAQTAAEMIWIKSMLSCLKVNVSLPMKMICDNQAAIHIANNPVFHERTKHIEVDCHYVRDLVQSEVISTHHVNTEDQVADMFTKALPISSFTRCCSKLSMIDIYAPA